MKNKFRLGVDILTIELVEQVALGQLDVVLDQHQRTRLDEQRQRVELKLSPDSPPAYGINTGFGALAEMRVSAKDLNRLQANLIRSHCTGVGPLFSVPITRAIMLLRAQVLAKTTSGARAAIVDLLVEMLNQGLHPHIPSKGSVGASGDLAPLAHLALSLILSLIHI